MADAVREQTEEQGLRAREWPLDYRTSSGGTQDAPADILHDFYIPALRLANSYDRVAGFFRSSSLAAASMGFSSFVNRGGKIRMIVGADLEEADIEAILKGDLQRLQRSLYERLEEPDQWPKDVQDGVALLGWMVGNGHLEVRVAFRVHAGTGKPLPFDSTEDGYVHEKWLVMRDEYGNRLYASGSLNESRTALQLNAENLEIHCDWWDQRSRQRADRAEDDFQHMWNGANNHIRVLSIPEAVRARLIEIGFSHRSLVEIDGTPAAITPQPSAEELLKFAMIRDAPRLPKGRFVGVYTAPVEPWPHQAVVASRLVETWPYSYLLCDEVGLGKTIEAALAFRGLYLSGIAKRILVAAPAGLTAQWQEQLWSKTLLRFGRVAGGATAAHDWIGPGGEAARSAESIYEPDLVVVSADLMAREQRLDVLRHAKPYDVALLDEAHTARRSNAPDGAAADPDYTKLYIAVRDVLRKQTRSLWMATATPMQLDPVEVHDLISLTDRVGAFQYDPTLAQQYYYLVSQARSGSKLHDADEEFLRKAVRSVAWQDPTYWRLLQESLGSRRCRDAMEAWLEGRNPVRGRDLPIWFRMLFGAAPLSRVMMRHTRPLLAIYQREGQLTQNLARRIILPMPAITMSDREGLVYSMLEDYCRGLAKQIAKHNNRSRQTSMGFVLSFFRLRFASSVFALFETARRRRDKVEATLRYGTPQDAHADYSGEAEDFRSDEEADEARAVTELLKDRSPEDLRWEYGNLTRLLETIGDLDGQSSKMKALLQVLDSRVDASSQRIKQTVIFTRFFDTLSYISAQLRMRKPEIRLGYYSGQGCGYHDADLAGMVSTDREDIKQRFLRGEIDVLVCTDAAAEGLNLQTADLLVNFDMGWNPMKLEQRIGRIDRIGQKHDTIGVLNLFYLGSAEEIVYGKLLSRLTQAGAVVGPQQMSLLPVNEDEFAALADGSLTEQQLYERCLHRVDTQKEQRMRMEMPPDELYELYNRMGRATRLEVPVRLEDLWEALISSDYLRKLGCGLVATDQGDYLTVSQAAGARQTTRLTVSREMYDEGLADQGPKLHFATYGDEEFDSLLNHMAQYGLPPCMRRLAVTPAGMQGVEVVGYAVNCQGVVGTVEARLVTSWQQLQSLIIDAESTIEDETMQVLGKELQRIADEEFGLCRSTGIVTDRNTQAAEANQVLNHVLIEAYLRDKRGTDGRVPFWQVDAELEMRLNDLQGEMWLSGVPRGTLRRISQHLLIDHGILDAPDGDPIKIPTIHLRAARDTARRVANGIRKRKSEITVDSVLAGLKRIRDLA